jgi:hypothetical protein
MAAARSVFVIIVTFSLTGIEVPPGFEAMGEKLMVNVHAPAAGSAVPFRHELACDRPFGKSTG